MDKKIMEEKNRIEEEKKKVEEEKKKQRMKMLNDQMNEIKIRKIQEYEDNLVEGQILKMQIRRDLAQEQKEKELKEKKILEQKQIYMEENKKLMEEKEKIKMREIEEEKKIEEFAIKKDELNALRKQKEEEKMKKITKKTILKPKLQSNLNQSKEEASSENANEGNDTQEVLMNDTEKKQKVYDISLQFIESISRKNKKEVIEDDSVSVQSSKLTIEKNTKGVKIKIMNYKNKINNLKKK